MGPAAASELGRSLVALGDVHADGSADFAVGAPGFSSNAGAVYLVLGHGPRTWLVDNDSDGFGTSAGSSRVCGEPAAGSRRALTNPKDWVLDLDGDRAVYLSTVQLRCARPESSGWIVYGPDVRQQCDAPPENPDYTSDNDASIYQGAPEVCDLKDNNCDGAIDDDQGHWPSWYPDSDGDGHGRKDATAVKACAAPPQHVASRTDCDDTRDTTYPGASEVCEQTGPQLDNNCDGNTEGAVNGTAWYRDADGDGYGAKTDTQKRCVRLAGYVEDSSDCNDANASVNPGRTELCEAGAFSDQVDNDCDGDKNDVDPDLPASAGGTRLWYCDADRDGHAGPGFKLRWCTNPTNLVAPATGNVLVQGTYLATEPDDCDDTRSGVFQRLSWYEDRDGDGCGNPLAGRESCGSPAGCGFPFVLNNKDTSDNNASDCRP
ncbi:MopE-related protein [Myxococcus faecalis]|uniref:MopE-related protein n=1 Tax=Myxococcus faecalis TaxID=3115646 RepID=UPI003CFA585E